MFTTQAHDLERALRARSHPLLADEFVLPDYQGRSLANAPATWAALLGAHPASVASPLADAYWQFLGEARRVIVVLLDALGYLQLGQMLDQFPGCLWARLAQRGRLLPMTSIAPSTTATALATVGSGVEPIAHGLLGYELWLREYGALAEMLSVKPAFGTGQETLLDWGFKPERFIPAPGLGALLAREGVETTALVPTRFITGGLTRMCYRGFTRMIGYAHVGGMWALARHALERDRAARSLYFLYWGGIDSAIHQHGSAGGHWQAAFHTATRSCEEQFISRLGPREREGTVCVLIADHGFVDSPEPLAHDTDADPVLRRELAIPYSGEARMAYLHCLAGDSDAALGAIQGALGSDFIVRRTRDLAAAGLFGQSAPAPESLARMGHFVALARGECYLDRREVRKKLRGRHGGLTPEEMLIPWLATRLDG